MGFANRGRTENWQTDGDCCRRASFLRSPQCHCAIAKTRLRNRATVGPTLGKAVAAATWFSASRQNNFFLDDFGSVELKEPGESSRSRDARATQSAASTEARLEGLIRINDNLQ